MVILTSEDRGKLPSSSCGHGAHANPTSGFWPTGVESCTSQVRSQKLLYL